MTTGESFDVIAVIDTGILNHSDLIRKVLPGYDFIDDVNVSNDDDASNYAPGNCDDVITVAASARDGGRAHYGNYGNSIDITAPGGDSTEDTMVYSTLDGGFTSPLNDDSYTSYQGTSMATPHIAGIVSLMASLQPSLNYSEALTLLAQTAKAFPTGTGNDCTTSLCGAGIVDAYIPFNCSVQS